MAVFYLDTSALVKLYFEEPGSARLEQAVTEAGVRLAISSLGALEFRAALRARARHDPRVSSETERVLEDFTRRAGSSFQRQGLTDAVFDLAALLLDRHPLRSPDALQLAACVELHRTQPAMAIQFVCSDRALLAAARAELVPCWDPAE